MPDPSPFDTFGLATTIITVASAGFGLLIAFAIIRRVIYIPKRRKILQDAGLDPRMAPVQLEARLASSALLAPAPPAAKTVEERLAELDSLHGRGLISSEELHQARAKILAS